MEEKKKKNIFLKILFIVFLIYFVLYLMDNFGYYNVSRKKTILTESKLEEFEQDIKNGKELDIKEYMLDETNYNNTYSDIGYKSSAIIDSILNKGFKRIGKILKQLFA